MFGEVQGRLYQGDVRVVRSNRTVSNHFALVKVRCLWAPSPQSNLVLGDVVRAVYSFCYVRVRVVSERKGRSLGKSR